MGTNFFVGDSVGQWTGIGKWVMGIGKWVIW
jgi:hypothetical protein